MTWSLLQDPGKLFYPNIRVLETFLTARQQILVQGVEYVEGRGEWSRAVRGAGDEESTLMRQGVEGR